MPTLPASPHFRLEELAQGVYAAIHTPGGDAIGNAGIIDLGDRTVIFDTCQSPLAAADLQRAAVTLCGRPVDYVVNSHWHSDHVLGNAVLADATIIATPTTRLLMATELVDHAVVLPNLTFGDYLALQGTARAVELRVFSGHTLSDAVLFVSDARIAFLADLHFVGIHPYLPDGDPADWLTSLAHIATYDIELAVPGHGDVSDLLACRQVREYITACQGIVGDAQARGATLESLLATPIPAPFDTWNMPSFYQDNLRFLYERSAGEGV